MYEKLSTSQLLAVWSAMYCMLSTAHNDKNTKLSKF